MTTKALLTAMIASSWLAPSLASATTEICGNGVDDDGNGLTDEGCYPTLTTGVCESPLSCGDTGMISWSTGSLHYDLPPDIAPAVPIGVGIGFRRFYTSMSVPGTNPTSVNKTPLGANWQHTYLTYLYAFTDAGSVKRITLHTSQGRDVYYTYSSTLSGFDYYLPQAGDHVLVMRVDTTNHLYYVQLLTGETLEYNSSGQLAEIWDTLPTPNKVLITWDSTTNGNVSTVTDANGKRRLSFTYTTGHLTSLQFQTLVSSVWTTQHTTTYDYDNSVTRDATSGWYVPASSTEWTTLLSGTGFSNPASLWLGQETTGNLADSIGTATATVNGTVTHQVAAMGWTRKGVKIVDGSAANYLTAPTPSAGTTIMFAQIFSLNTNPASGYRAFNCIGLDVFEEAQLVNGPKVRAQSAGNTATSAGNYSGTVLVVTKLDYTHTTFAVYTDSGDILKPTYSNQDANTSSYLLGDGAEGSDATLLYSTMFTGAAAELTDAQVATLIRLMKFGPGLSSVTIGGQLAQKYTYNANGSLAQITDGGSTNIATFTYDSTTLGKVVRVDTSRGTVGLEYSSARTACASDTILYFNKGNTTSCSIDSDCGTGFLCGGKTGSGTTGTCFLAARCMATSTVNGEAVVTNVTPLGPGGGSCTGACTDVAQYSWSTATGLLNVTGQKDPIGNYTSAAFNSNGLPTQIGYGDTDTDPTNGGTNRTVYYFYDTTFPGRLSEVRRASDLSSVASSCSATSTTGCNRTLYSYGTDNQLHTIEQDGWTLNSSGAIVTFANVITYTHDTKGRISEIDGAVSGIRTTFDYFTSTDPNSDQFLQDYKSYYDGTHFLEPAVTGYDFWGHPISLEDPNGDYTCDTYDSARGFLSSRRKAMATTMRSCSNPNAADLTTGFARDSALRLTQLTRPDGSCLFYAYDSNGRLTSTKRRDDCNSASTGDTQTFTYSPDSQVTEVDTYNASSTLTAKQPYTYFDGRQLQEIVNPADTSKFTGLVYDAAGKVIEVDGASSLSKTVYHFDGAPGRDNRVSSIQKYKTSSTSDTWSLLYAWLGDQAQVTDGDSKVTGSTRDDLGRLVKISSPDFADPTVRVFDAAGRLTTVVEVEGGGGSQQTHTFTYDNLSRPLNSDYQNACATTGTAHPEIQRAYDALPSGVTCPAKMTSGCINTSGRLAYVEVILMCSSTYATTDGSLDQFTFYAYDDAGRVIEEYIKDDTGRTADHLYTYTKNGVLSQMKLPSNTVIGSTFGSAGSNSDTDLVTGLWRATTGTPIIDTVQWNPFGPLLQYNQKNAIAGFLVQTLVTRNLAYRITDLKQKAGSTTLLDTAITEDAMGRVTQRVYSSAATGVTSSYFLYDEQSRVTCETTDLQSTCPATGTDIKNNHSLSPPFMNAGDWKRVLRPVNGSTSGLINDFDTSGTTYGTSHQVTDVNQSDGTPALGHTAIAYDARGNRSSDDNTTTETDDARTYTYDGRRNVVNVRGQYYTGGVWHFYDVASAFDAKNRRVFKSFFDETTTKTATWFFYYDTLDRMVEVNYTPDTSLSTTFSVFQLFWLGDRLVAYWETDYPAATTSQRYVGTDEAGRPIDMWTWPATGDATRAWAINPSAWGFDTNKVGPTVFQPILFAGQYQDTETAAYENNGTTIHRPGLALNGFRTYDPFVSGYLQIDPLVNQTWSSYVYAGSDPVGSADPVGLANCPTEEPGCGGYTGGGIGAEDGGGGNSCGEGCALACSLDLDSLAGVFGATCDCNKCNIGEISGSGGGVGPLMPPPSGATPLENQCTASCEYCFDLEFQACNAIQACGKTNRASCEVIRSSEYGKHLFINDPMCTVIQGYTGSVVAGHGIHRFPLHTENLVLSDSRLEIQCPTPPSYFPPVPMDPVQCGTWLFGQENTTLCIDNCVGSGGSVTCPMPQDDHGGMSTL